MVLDLRRWMTAKAVAKYTPMISASLRNMSSDQWGEALQAFENLGDIVNAEMNRRIDDVKRFG